MMPVEKMKYGLAEFDDNSRQTFIHLMKSPFTEIERIKSGEKKEQ